MNEVTVTSVGNLQNEVVYHGGESFVIDEPVSAGGQGSGPDPYTLLLAAIGGCISMTVTLYARRKEWPLERVTVRLRQNRVHVRDCAECDKTDDRYVHRIERTVSLQGPLTNEQRERLQQIARQCPVHKTLTSGIVITDLEDGK